MRYRWQWIHLLLALAVCSLLTLPALAQEPEREKAELTLKNVKQRLKENEKFLREARTKGRAGDARGMETALENYSRGMEGLNRALSQGRFHGDAYEQEDAWNRVEKATRKHGEVLTDLYERVPEQARPAIARAMENSQRGRTTALENLERARSERLAVEARGAGRPGTSGRPDVAARAGDSERPAGPPSGVGGGTPGGIGGGRPAGGPPAGAGRPGGRP